MATWAWALIDRFRGERMRGRMGNAPIRPRIFLVWVLQPDGGARFKAGVLQEFR